MNDRPSRCELMTREGHDATPYADLFEKVLARPAMYVGNCRVERIGAFLDGFIHARREAGEDAEDDPYLGFNRFVARRFRIQSMHNWVGIVEFMATSEAAAYELTLKLWNEYKAALDRRSKRKRRAPARG